MYKIGREQEAADMFPRPPRERPWPANTPQPTEVPFQPRPKKLAPPTPMPGRRRKRKPGEDIGREPF